MKNPLLDAIKQMKAKRVAIMVGDADELGLPDMNMGMGDDQAEEMEESPEMESTEDESMEQTGSEVDESMDLAEDDGEEMPETEMPAEKMMGRKPFDKKKPAGQSASEDSGDGIPDSVAKDLYDEDMVNKMKSGGKKPNGLMARAQMNLSKRFGK